MAGPIGPEPAAILVHPSGTTINLILNANASSPTNILLDDATKYPGYTHMALAVTDVDAVAADLQGIGAHITEGPIEFPGARAIFIRDPDSNVIEFNQAVSST